MYSIFHKAYKNESPYIAGSLTFVHILLLKIQNNSEWETIQLSLSTLIILQDTLSTEYFKFVCFVGVIIIFKIYQYDTYNTYSVKNNLYIFFF